MEQFNSMVVQMVKNLSTVRSLCLGQKGPLEKVMATYTSILAWRIPWTEEPSRLQSMGSQRVRQDCATNTFTFTHTHKYCSVLHILSINNKSYTNEQ